jgi:hypothetical protein
MNLPPADGHLPVGFPHSEISGSGPVSGSPELIAAVHVLHRLWLPRHSPYALCNLTLSLRHASRSRAGFDLRKSRPSCALHVVRFVVVTLGRFYPLRCSENISFAYSIFKEQWQGCLPALPWPGWAPAETFVELIGIEPMTSGLQSQRSPN